MTVPMRADGSSAGIYQVAAAGVLFVDWAGREVGGATHCDPYVAEA